MKGAPRKLRKSCSLPTCSKTPGECMHCTCDGRCGQHAGGRCGVRREGNGKSCKREGCLRDETCLHSTRATCCHCRNLVSSSNRTSRKRTRTEASVSVVLNTTPVVTVAVTASQTAVLKMEEMEEMKQHIEAAHGGGEDKTKAKTEGEEDDGAASPTSCDALLPLSADLFVDFEICEELLVVTKKPRTEALTMEDLDELKDDKLLDVEQFITPSITLQTEEQEQKMEEEDDEEDEEEEDDEVVVLTPKSLSEYEAYAARRAACNLVVVVEGVQFNLHKHPMLLESQLLNAKARESVLTTPSPVPVIRLPVFPGGVEAFEALCVYAYTGELPLSVDNVASLFCAVQFLNMGFAVASKTRDFLSSITSQTSVEPLLRVTQDAQALMTKHDSLQVCQQLQLECVDALARAMPLESAAVGQLLSLPIELFLQVTQEMLATRGPQDLAMDTVRQLVVQAELAQLHRTALDAETEKQDEKKTEAVQQSLALLQRSLKGDAADEEFRSAGRLAAAVGDAATPDDEDDALFMKMMGEFEMDSTSEDELLGDGPVVSSSGFIDPLSFEPFAFSSRRESSHHRMLSSAFAV